MSARNQFFFKKKMLKKLIATFEESYPGTSENPLEFKGLVFSPATNENGYDVCFAFPLVAPKGMGAGDDGAMLIQVTRDVVTTSREGTLVKTPLNTMGCVYPPPCKPPYDKISAGTLSFLETSVLQNTNDCYSE